MSSSIFKKSVYLFALPALLMYLTFWIVPILMTFYLSLTDSNGFAPGERFIGMDNFKTLFEDGSLMNAMKNTFIFMIVSVVLINAFAIIVAFILNMPLRLKGIYRTVFYVPTLFSAVVVGFVWGYVYAPNYGMIASLLHNLGFDIDPNYLGNTSTALFAVILVEVWKSAGFAVVIYLAGLQSMSEDLLEAARIDGSGRWRLIWNIRLPLLASAITVNVILGLINGMKAFDFVFVMTSGGPAKSTETLLYSVYKMAFVELNFGKGAALGVVSFLITMLFTSIVLPLLRKREVEA